jgi:hypothetical protein
VNVAKQKRIERKERKTKERRREGDRRMYGWWGGGGGGQGDFQIYLIYEETFL